MFVISKGLCKLSVSKLTC